MTALTRRQFLELGAKFTALLGLGSAAVPQTAAALSELALGRAPVLWLQGLSCSGCSISLLNADSPGPAEILTDYLSLLFHANLSAATGAQALEVIENTIREGDYLLVVEGGIPGEMPEACMMGAESVNNQVLRAARRARAVVCVGTCAAYGGIPAAENNPTGALSVPAFLEQERLGVPTILLPGCPAHPDWMVGTLVHLLKFGLPPLDEQNRPTMFYSRLVHDQCPRFADYERERFAKDFSDDGCLFKLGCLGPNTRADCSLRLWNSGTSFCINANAPCVGCASEDFAVQTGFPFYPKSSADQKKGA